MWHFADNGHDELSTFAYKSDRERSVLQSAKDKTEPVSRWAVQLQARVGYWKAIVAIAAKNARMCWAVLKRGEAFKLPA